MPRKKLKTKKKVEVFIGTANVLDLKTAILTARTILHIRLYNVY